MHLRHTQFWQDLMHGVYGPRSGGARIIVDSENSATGVGKTTAAVSIALAVSKAFDYDLSPDDFTLSGEQYLNRWREHPGASQPSVIVLDELSGAGAGDARRSMSNENVNLGRSWQLMRKKRIVTICTLPHWSDADKRLRRSADYRIWCLERPIGYFRPYKVTSTFDKGDVRTESYSDVQRIAFPNLDKLDDPYFQAITEKKDALLASDEFDANAIAEIEDESTKDPEEVEREQKIEDAQRARNTGLSTREVADIVGMSQSWVNRYTDAPQPDSTSAPADD
jgi:transcriptional regulator with XRE-family HTH domain